MNEGIKLDALIAERVFGFKDVETWHPDNLRHYSTDISEAWRVVEKMADIGGKVAIEFEGYFTYHQIDIFGISPLTICLAALKAIDVDTKGVK